MDHCSLATASITITPVDGFAFEVQISVEPQSCASISPEKYGPLFPGDSLSITITPVDGFAFDQWSGTINPFEETITIFGTQTVQLVKK